MADMEWSTDGFAGGKWGMGMEDDGYDGYGKEEEYERERRRRSDHARMQQMHMDYDMSLVSSRGGGEGRDADTCKGAGAGAGVGDRTGYERGTSIRRDMDMGNTLYVHNEDSLGLDSGGLVAGQGSGSGNGNGRVLSLANNTNKSIMHDENSMSMMLCDFGNYVAPPMDDYSIM